MTREYRILLLDHTQWVTRQEHIYARNDRTALRRAGSLAGAQSAEVWEGLRQVARLPCGHGHRATDRLSAGPGPAGN